MIQRRGVVIAPEELDQIWEQRIYDAGINVVGLHPDPKGRPAGEAVRAFLTAENRKRLSRMEENGITVEWEMHTLSWLLPRELFSEHPEWFRMNENGERTPDFNLCASSDEALEKVSCSAAELAEMFRPKSHRYYFWLDDVAQSACRCPSCRNLSRADQALKTYNAILRGIRRTDPKGMQCYLAYHDVNAVPQKIRPEEGIFLEYAPMIRDFDKCIADESSEKNKKELRHLGELLDFFGREDAQVLDYWLDNSLFSDWKKPPKVFQLHLDTLRADAAYYKQMGFESITTFACYLGADYVARYPEPDGIQQYGHVLADV